MRTRRLKSNMLRTSRTRYEHLLIAIRSRIRNRGKIVGKGRLDILHQRLSIRVATTHMKEHPAAVLFAHRRFMLFFRRPHCFCVLFLFFLVLLFLLLLLAVYSYLFPLSPADHG